MFKFLRKNTVERKPINEEFFHFWAHFELGSFRTTVIAVVVIAVLMIIILVQQRLLSAKDDVIAELSEKRVMICFPDDSGMFVSAKKIPERIVVNFARGFVANMYNFSSYNVSENTDEARRLMSPQLANDYIGFFKDTVDRVKKDGIMRHFDIKEFQPPVETDRGYVVQFRGLVRDFVGQTPIGEARVLPVTVWLNKVEHTKTTPEGLVVAAVSDKPLDQSVIAAETKRVAARNSESAKP